MAKDIGKASGSPRDWFGQALVTLADKYQFSYVDMDVAGGTGGHRFRDKYPDRFIQCGISEQAAAGIAAGLAAGTDQPVIFSTFASFGLRALEILQLQAFYNNLPVIVCLSHLGLDVGPDGASAQSLNHYAIWRSIPGNAPVIHPSCPAEMNEALKYLLELGGPGVLLTGRSPVDTSSFRGFPYHREDLIVFPHSNTVVYYIEEEAIQANIISAGHTVSQCVEAARQLASEGIVTTVHSAWFLKPFDFNCIDVFSMTGKPVITVEDHGLAGGLFEAVAGAMVQTARPSPVVPVYVDGWGQSGEPSELVDEYEAGVEAIIRAVKAEV